MPDQEPQAANAGTEGQQGLPVTTMDDPVVIPMEDPTAGNTPTITADPPAPAPAFQGQPPQPAVVQETPEQYWRRIAQENREDAAAFKEFSPIIGHLQQNPGHIDYLQQAIDNEAAGMLATGRMAVGAAQNSPQGMSEADALAAELGVDPPIQGQAPQPTVVRPHQMTTQEAMKLGAEKERAAQEFTQFHKDVASMGIPEHVTDQFVQYLQKPNAFTLMDLFVSWRHKQGPEAPPVAGPGTAPPEGQPVIGKPMSVTAMPAGASSRPDQNLYQAGNDGSKFVADPSNI